MCFKEERVCICPDCNRMVPHSRLFDKRNIITCSKKCSSNWNHISIGSREKIRGKKYGKDN